MLDYYLSVPPPQDFVSPLPFHFATEKDALPEGVIGDIVPNRIYSSSELLAYLKASREKYHQLLANMREENLLERWVENSEAQEPMDYPVLEILLYNLRHLQHHTAQLNLLLRQNHGLAPGWIA
ncbi:MAG: DinB family protein [Microscillaceae bacterium]|nr:DinB family protein [Microscillaceae bacterium]